MCAFVLFLHLHQVFIYCTTYINLYLYPLKYPEADARLADWLSEHQLQHTWVLGARQDYRKDEPMRFLSTESVPCLHSIERFCKNGYESGMPVNFRFLVQREPFPHEVAAVCVNAKEISIFSEKASFDPFIHNHDHVCTRARKTNPTTTKGLETFCTSEPKTSNYFLWHETLYQHDRYKKINQTLGHVFREAGGHLDNLGFINVK